MNTIKYKFKSKLKLNYYYYLYNKLEPLNLNLNDNDTIRNKLKENNYLSAKKQKAKVYLYNIKYYSHPTLVAGRMEYYFETDNENLLVIDLKPKTINYIASCTCEQFNNYHAVQVPCKHIYKLYLNLNKNAIINVYDKISYFKNNIPLKLKLTNQKRIDKLKKELTKITNEINYYKFALNYSIAVNVHQHCKFKLNQLYLKRKELENYLNYLNSKLI